MSAGPLNPVDLEHLHRVLAHCRTALGVEVVPRREILERPEGDAQDQICWYVSVSAAPEMRVDTLCMLMSGPYETQIEAAQTAGVIQQHIMAANQPGEPDTALKTVYSSELQVDLNDPTAGRVFKHSSARVPYLRFVSSSPLLVVSPGNVAILTVQNVVSAQDTAEQLTGAQRDVAVQDLQNLPTLTHEMLSPLAGRTECVASLCTLELSMEGQLREVPALAFWNPRNNVGYLQCSADHVRSAVWYACGLTQWEWTILEPCSVDWKLIDGYVHRSVTLPERHLWMEETSI